MNIRKRLQNLADQAIAETSLVEGEKHYDNHELVLARGYFITSYVNASSVNTQEKAIEWIYKINETINQENVEMEAQDKSAHSYRVNTQHILYSNPLGSGVSATVYLGEYNNKKIAIKKHTFQNPIPHNDIKNERDILKFLTENDASNNHVIGFSGYFIIEGSYSLCIEYMDRGTLSDSLDKLTLNEQNKIILDIAKGVEFIHGKGIVHHDLKPANILLTGTNLEAKLGDFGYASREGMNSDKTKGTPLFVAPEKWLKVNGKLSTELSGKPCDIYSLSAVFWCVMAKRENLYAGMNINNSDELYNWVVVQNKREEIPATWNKTIRSMIEIGWFSDPTKRPTATQIVKELTSPATPEVKPNSAMPRCVIF